MLEHRIPLHVDDALDSLDDHLNRMRIPLLRGNGKKCQIRLYWALSSLAGLGFQRYIGEKN